MGGGDGGDGGDGGGDGGGGNPHTQSCTEALLHPTMSCWVLRFQTSLFACVEEQSELQKKHPGGTFSFEKNSEP